MLDINEVVIQVSIIIITSLFAYFARFLKIYLDEKIELVKVDKDDKYAQLKAKYLEEGKNILFEIMVATEGTLVKGIREINEDGKLDLNDAKRIKTLVSGKFKNTINKNVEDNITEFYGDLDTFIDIIIESNVDRLK